MTLHALRGFPEQFSKKTRWHLRPGGITEHILDRQEPTIIHDLVDCPLSINQVLIEAGIKSLIAVPFQAKGKRVRILYIDDYELRQWTPHEVNFLVLLSVQAAVAIEKFKLLEEISEARAYFANVLDNSADIIMTTDPDRRIVEFNKGASRILGYSKEELVGKSIETLWVNPDERQEILDAMNRFGYVVNHETRLKAKNGKVIDVSLTLSFLDGGNGKKPGTVGVSKDITEKKRLERELEKRNRDLHELNEKLESKVMERTAELSRANRELERSNELKSKFIANMSHELRTPLNSILGFSELLRDDTVQPLTKKQKRFATNIHNSGSHLLQLINNILDIAKIESGKITLSYESFSIQQVISEVESIVRSLSDKKVLKLRTWITEDVTMDIPIFVITEKNITPQERLRLAGKIVSYMQKRYFTKEDLLMHMRNLELTHPVQAGLLDEVSGLLDYSYFQIRLAQEVSRAKRYKNTFTVILVDLDHFTDYIRANGSHQSDICIRKIAEFLKKSTRGSDTVVRYGADEFAVILSNTVQEKAIVMARRLHAYIEDYPFYGEELTPNEKITASVAVVNHPRDGEVPEEILATAHDLMRTIKEKGGGRIEFYEHKSRSKNTDRRG